MATVEQGLVQWVSSPSAAAPTSHVVPPPRPWWPCAHLLSTLPHHSAPLQHLSLLSPRDWHAIEFVAGWADLVWRPRWSVAMPTSAPILGPGPPPWCRRPAVALALAHRWRISIPDDDGWRVSSSSSDVGPLPCTSLELERLPAWIIRSIKAEKWQLLWAPIYWGRCNSLFIWEEMGKILVATKKKSYWRTGGEEKVRFLL
jgi:hypothetical protein